MLLRILVITPLALGFAVLLPPAPAARADVVVLKTGRKIEGTVEEKGDQVVVRLESGSRFTFERADVESIEKTPPPWEVYEAKAKTLKPEDIAGHLELARWCQSKSLSSRAQKELDLVLAREPDNADAHAMLGQEKYEGKWLTREEVLKAKGFVQVEGVWLGPREYELYKQRKDAEEAQKKAFEAEKALLESLADKDAAKAAESRKHYADLGEKALPNLFWALYNLKGNPAARLEAAKLINSIGIRDAKWSQALASRAAMDDNDDCVKEICRGIAARKDDTALTFLVWMAAQDNPARRRAAWCLATIKDPRAYRALIGCLVGKNTNNLPGQMGMNLQNMMGQVDRAGNAASGGVQMGEVLPAADSLEAISGREYKNDVGKWLKWLDEVERAPGGAVVDPKKGN